MSTIEQENIGLFTLKRFDVEYSSGKKRTNSGHGFNIQFQQSIIPKSAMEENAASE